MRGFLRDLWVLYRREVRSALRERSIVVNGVLVPIFLYPFLLWALFTAMTFVEGQTEGFVSRVAVPDSASLPGLVTALEDRGDVRIARGIPADSLDGFLARGDLDAVVRAVAVDSTLPADRTPVRVDYDGAEGRSRSASIRIEAEVDALRMRRLTADAAALGIDTVALEGFAVAMVDVASDREAGRVVLGVILPLLLTVMVALGCFVPAVDTTAGERERSTWETLWTTGVSRESVVLAKYLLVATVGSLAGVLNVAAISVTLGGILTPVAGDRAQEMGLALPWEAVPVMLVVAVLLALLFAALMMVLAAFARSFKEGQAMITPAFYLAMAPFLLGMSPDRGLTPTIALVPVANVALALKDAILGRGNTGLLIIAVWVNVVLVGVCLYLARSVLAQEDVVTGEFQGSFWTWLRRRLRRA